HGGGHGRRRRPRGRGPRAGGAHRPSRRRLGARHRRQGRGRGRRPGTDGGRAPALLNASAARPPERDSYETGPGGGRCSAAGGSVPLSAGPAGASSSSWAGGRRGRSPAMPAQAGRTGRTAARSRTHVWGDRSDRDRHPIRACFLCRCPRVRNGPAVCEKDRRASVLVPAAAVVVVAVPVGVAGRCSGQLLLQALEVGLWRGVLQPPRHLGLLSLSPAATHSCPLHTRSGRPEEYVAAPLVFVCSCPTL